MAKKKSKAVFSSAVSAATNDVAAPVELNETKNEMIEENELESLKAAYAAMLQEKNEATQALKLALDSSAELRQKVIELEEKLKLAPTNAQIEELTMKNSELEFDNARLNAQVAQLSERLLEKSPSNEVSFIQKTPIMSKHVTYTNRNIYSNNGYGTWR